MKDRSFEQEKREIPIGKHMKHAVSAGKDDNNFNVLNDVKPKPVKNFLQKK